MALKDLHVVKHFAVFELFVCAGFVFFPPPPLHFIFSVSLTANLILKIHALINL